MSVSPLNRIHGENISKFIRNNYYQLVNNSLSCINFMTTFFCKNLKCLRNDIAKFYSLMYKSRDSVHSGRFSKSQTGIRCNFRAEHAGD